MNWTLTIILWDLPPEYKMSNEIINSWGEDMAINKVKSFLHQRKVLLNQQKGESTLSTERSKSLLYAASQHNNKRKRPLNQVELPPHPSFKNKNKTGWNNVCRYCKNPRHAAEQCYFWPQPEQQK